jgi:hypothetical protein
VSDVFLSYASADRPRVAPLVEALRTRGWSVWWDRTVAPGKTWDDVIESALADARCVVVLWSRNSIRSHWVLTEAEEARNRGILVPALLEDVTIPLAFRRIQAADLVDWSGGMPSSGCDELAGAVSEVLSSHAPAPVSTATAGRSAAGASGGVPTTFFSYAREDSEFALNLARELRKAGANVWLDQLDIREGRQWDREVQTALAKCDEMIVVLSPAACDSENVLDEVGFALDHRKSVIPVIKSTCDIPYRLSRRHYVDFTSDHEQALHALLAALEIKEALNRPGDERLVIFDPVKAKGIEFAARLNAAEALGQAGDPRLRESNWVRIAGDGKVKTFEIGKYPVTVAEYERFMANNGYAEERWWKAGGYKGANEPEDWETQKNHPNWPVTGVSWYEAAAYAAWCKARLPREAEWELAARGKEGREYPWGPQEPDATRANYRETGPGHATPVGLYPAGGTPDGAQDMAGNVWEWVDPKSALRGGSWNSNASILRASDRLWNEPEYRSYLIGFRVARDVFP